MSSKLNKYIEDNKWSAKGYELDIIKILTFDYVKIRGYKLDKDDLKYLRENNINLKSLLQ